MAVKNFKNLKPKDLIVFDVDGTLAPTKSEMDADMVELFKHLLRVKKVAVISGAKYEIMKMQLANSLKASPDLLRNLFLFPTTATTFLRYNHGWKKVYALTLSPAKVKKLRRLLKECLGKLAINIQKKLMEN